MCGIAGILDTTDRDGDLSATITRMTETLIHRGPDSDGIWVDSTAGIALGQWRLSIVDLSEAGSQPMVSADGRWVITYNGGIYNAGQIAAGLTAAGVRFRGHSDTEVLLEACAAWGVRSAIKQMIGMFVFAIWDRRDRRLFLARDRLGIKPLYWAHFGGLFLFGSELKALRAHRGWPVTVDRDAVAAFMRLSYVPAPWSIYCGVRKLEPGRILTVGDGSAPTEEVYWSLRDVASRAKAKLQPSGVREQLDRLEETLRDAVRIRMISDVPLGAFLSGGIDSSTIVALMQGVSKTPVRTFSAGFYEARFNEAEHARAVARHLGTEHTELYLDPREVIASIDRLAEIYDEPFGDSSEIPTLLISKMARRDVTVVLTGDGGDELFAGYHHYFSAASWPYLDILPAPLRKLLAAFVRNRLGRPSNRRRRLARILVEDRDDLYREFMSHWLEPELLLPGAREAHGAFWQSDLRDMVPDLLSRMQFTDTVSYLPDDILTKVDRASMAVSLEARVPMLDHRVVEQAWSLPRDMKMRDRTGKWLLRQLLYRHVPRQLVDRPKRGFGIPIATWLRGEWQLWAEEYFAPDKLEAGGLDPGVVQAA